jgi:hypothetical protein
MDNSFDEADPPVSNPEQLYDNVPGMSGPRAVPDKPKAEYRLPRSVRRCVAHPGDADYVAVFDSED